RRRLHASLLPQRFLSFTHVRDRVRLDLQGHLRSQGRSARRAALQMPHLQTRLLLADISRRLPLPPAALAPRVVLAPVREVLVAPSRSGTLLPPRHAPLAPRATRPARALGERRFPRSTSRPRSHARERFPARRAGDVRARSAAFPGNRAGFGAG